MSTRGCIARLTSKPGNKITFRGSYAHWDNYPSGAGSSLFKLRNGFFKSDTNAMLKILIDEFLNKHRIDFRKIWLKMSGKNLAYLTKPY